MNKDEMNLNYLSNKHNSNQYYSPSINSKDFKPNKKDNHILSNNSNSEQSEFLTDKIPINN